MKVGDVIVAVNGVGYRRFPPDYDDGDLEDVTLGLDLITLVDSKEEEGGGEGGGYYCEEGGGRWRWI